MRNGPELKDLLRGRSQFTSLEELRDSGRQKVRVINPETIASLIQEQLPRFAEENGWVPRDRVEELVEKGRAELRHLLQTREAEVAAAREQLAEVEDMRGRERDSLAEMDRLREENERLRRQAGSGGGAGATVAPNAMERLLGELATLNANVQSMNKTAGPTPQASGDAGLAEKLEGIAERLSRKLDGITVRRGDGSSSGGVNEPEIRFDGLFASDLDRNLETNMEDVGVKNRDGKGIGGNLDKIRRLRGGK